MNMRFLGKTGLKVSELCLGTLTFGGPQIVGGLDQNGANALVNAVLEAGVNFFDSADIYSYGASETILGRALGSRRKAVIVGTKVRGLMGRGPNDGGVSRHHIVAACEASLKRLGTDYIDLYQVHSYDFNTPLEETLRALDDLVRQGKVRYIGCSNFAGWHLMKSLAISDKHGLERFVNLQANYNLLVREAENELVPVCLDQGLGITVWSPLAAGFLSGKFRRGQARPQGTRLSNPGSPFSPKDEEKGFRIIEVMDGIAAARGVSDAQIALNYLLRKPGVTSLVIGARNLEQLKDNLNTVSWQLTPEEITRLDTVSKPPDLYPYWFFELLPHDKMME